MMKKYILLFIAFVCSTLIYAQTKIQGVVVDDIGEALPGVVVKEKGTNNVAVTNIDGIYEIKVNNPAKGILTFSMISYKMQEIRINGRNSVNAQMYIENEALSEVVVVGYGTQKKVSITGAISSMGNKELMQVPTASVTNSLSGRIPGLVSRQSSGKPGDDAATLYIRGLGSPNNISPLCMIDGIEREINQIPPDDIESISVLKDASATAVYGVRGANGVILITTKRGAEGKPKITFTGEFGVTKSNRLPEKLDAANHAILKNEGLRNEGLQPLYTEEDIRLYQTGEDPFLHPNNDYLDIFFKDGKQQKYNFNISGGNKKIKYFVSAGIFNQDGIYETDLDKIKSHPTVKRLMDESEAVRNTLSKGVDYDPAYWFKRFSLRSNVDVNITEELKVSADLMLRTETTNRPYGLDGEVARVFGNLVRTPAGQFPLLNENGTFAATDRIVRGNLLHVNVYSGFYRNVKSIMESTFKLDYDMKKLLKGLFMSGKFSYDAKYENARGLNVQYPIYSYNSVSQEYTRLLEQTLPTSTSSYIGGGPNKKIYGELSVNYANTFAKKHQVSALVLGNIISNFSSSTAPPPDDRYIPQIYQGLVGRATYEFDGRYLFEINMGYNGSNRFPEERRYALFPAVSLGWVITEEAFLKDKTNILSFLKLRGSYGEVGNDKFGDGFSYYYNSVYESGQGYNFGISPTGVNGYKEGKMGNKNVTWERARKSNIGIDSKWLNSRLSFVGDLFYEQRDGILRTPVKYTNVSGVSSFSPANSAAVENKGFELSLGWDDRIGKDFQYYLKGIYSFARNKYTKVNESDVKYDYQKILGTRITQYRNYQAIGFFSSYEDILSSPFQQEGLKPGDIKYRDVNGDGKIDNFDIIPMGYGYVPEVTYSFGGGISFKGFDMNILFQGADNASVMLTGDITYEFTNEATVMKHHLGRWTPETANQAIYPRLASTVNRGANTYKSDQSSFFMYDASYLRLKSVEVGYSLPSKLLTGTPISSVRFYANAYNLYTWDKVKVVDPESDGKNNGYFYPQQMILNGGVTLNF